MQKRHRIFIAINLPKDIKRELAKHQEKWQESFASLSPEGDFAGPAKWVSKDNIHITLEFLGYLTDEELGEACMIVKEVAKRHSSFSINLNKIAYGGVKPGSDPRLAPKMIWVIGQDVKELANLKNDLQESLLGSVRFTPENRKFVPHVTLARIKEWEFKKIDIEERPDVNEDIDLIFTVESIEVMESVLKRGGPVYTILESHTLGE